MNYWSTTSPQSVIPGPAVPIPITPQPGIDKESERRPPSSGEDRADNPAALSERLATWLFHRHRFGVARLSLASYGFGESHPETGNG